MEENKDRTAGNDILRDAARQGSADGAAKVEGDTIVFRREAVRNRPAQSPDSASDMENTAQIRGGAVVRPLKQQRQPSPVAPQSAPQQRMPAQGTPQNAPQQRMPVQGTPQNAPRQRMPVQGTPQSAPQQRVPVQGTPQNAPQQRVPVQGTPQNAPQQRMPVQGTPQNAPQQRMPVQGTPQNAPQQRVPVQGTPQSAPQQRIPVQGTPQNAVQNGAVVPASAQPQPRPRTENDDFEIDEAATRNAGRIRKDNRDKGAADSATSAIMSVVKAVVYIVSVVVVSVVLAVFIINTANDVFKFVVEEKTVEVTLEENATIDDLADKLYENGLIKYKWAFKLWSNLKDSDAQFEAKTALLSTTMNYDYLRAAFKKSTRRQEVRVTIPEGYTVDEIIDILVESGVGTEDAFIDVINNYDFDYRFLENISTDPNRIYRLEGYLFPDTYNFYKDSDPKTTDSEVAAIAKLLSNFDKKFAPEYYDRCAALGLTVDEAITLASIVEKETRYADELGYVSSVFHNRLKYSATFPYLESDATTMYAIAHDRGSRLDTMTGQDLEYETAYNTHKNRGLPPGAIANPGLNAIKYALYPNESNYFFFLSDSSGRTYFASTNEEHNRNKALYLGN